MTHVARHRDEVPRTVAYMLRCLGVRGKSGADLLSYLVFEQGYCRDLLDLGYTDAQARADEIRAFLWG